LATQIPHDPSAVKDLSGQKKVITTNDCAPAVVSRHKIQAWRVAIWLHFGSQGRQMCFGGDKGFSMSVLHQSLQSKATKLPDPPPLCQSSPFPSQRRKGDLKKSHISDGYKCHYCRFTDKFRFQNLRVKWVCLA
jgi:hypothetical protein